MRNSKDSTLSGGPLSEMEEDDDFDQDGSAAHRTATLNEKDKKEMIKELARLKVVDAKMTDDRTQNR